jgi:hypothetical protein
MTSEIRVPRSHRGRRATKATATPAARASQAVGGCRGRRRVILDVLAFVGRVIELTGPLGLGSLGLQVNDLIGKGVHVSSSVGLRWAR